MRRTELLQEIRRMRFEEADRNWTAGRLRQEAAARLLGVCERTLRRYKGPLTPFGRAMKPFEIEMLAAYAPEARGRREPAVGTHQGRLPQALAAAGSAFVPWIGGALDDLLCAQFERTVGPDNGVRFEGQVLPIPADQHRCHYLKAQVRGHRYLAGRLAIFHGPRTLADIAQRVK